MNNASYQSNMRRGFVLASVFPVSSVSSNANTGCILNVATDYCNAADTVSIQVTSAKL